MEGAKGFSLRQKKSKRVPISGPKPISAPIAQSSPNNVSVQPRQRPNVNGRVDAENTAELVKRRYSTRFNTLPDFGSGKDDIPAIPSIPMLPPGFGKSVDNAAAVAAANGFQTATVDQDVLKNPGLPVEQYCNEKLGDLSEAALREYQQGLNDLKSRASTDLQQNVYQNRTQFIKVSKETEKLKGEMRTLRALMSELTTAVNMASISAGVPEPSAMLDEGARSKARKQANRSSLANLEAMWSTQLHALWKTVEGSQKYLPAVPGRHIICEQGGWLELDAATWKARRHAHILLLNDHLMIATVKKKRNEATDAQKSKVRIVADRCWALQDIDMVDVASLHTAPLGEKSSMANAISIRNGHESFTYRSDKPTNADKSKLLQEFRRAADELRKTIKADMEEQSIQIQENIGLQNPLVNGPNGHRRTISDVRKRPDILFEVDGKHQNLRWLDGQIDDLDSEIALQRFEDAVRRIEKLRKLGKGLSKSNYLAQEMIASKLDERAKQLSAILTTRLRTSHARLSPTQQNIAHLVRLNFDILARTTYLQARSDAIHQRTRAIIFTGDLRNHIRQLSYIYFALMRNTVLAFQQCFPPPVMSACVKWCSEKLAEFNTQILGRQLRGSVKRDSPTWKDCVAGAKECAGKMMGEVGFDFVSLVGVPADDGDDDGIGVS